MKSYESLYFGPNPLPQISYNNEYIRGRHYNQSSSLGKEREFKPLKNKYFIIPPHLYCLSMLLKRSISSYHSQFPE